MMRVFKATIVVAAIGSIGWAAWAFIAAPPTAEPEGRAQPEHAALESKGERDHASEGKTIGLSPEQRKSAGIKVESILPAALPKVFRAPGEVRTNDYSTTSVTARHQAIVVERKAKLGDKVAKGQPLLELFSAEMAEAQAAFVLAEQEYQRLSKLSRDFVARRVFAEAEAKRHETRAKLATFGLANEQIDAIATNGMSAKGAGKFDIVAPASGTVVSDDFRIGAVVEPGKVLFVITDPSNVWIEAHVSPAVAPEIAGDVGKIYIFDREIVAQVVQVQHQIDETTRTIGIRLQANDVDGGLKPGLFVDVELYGKAESVLSVPTNAIIRGPDGDWTIYVENEKGQLEPREVTVLYSVGDRTVLSGITSGTRVVTQGAFFVMAEAAKSGFDPHNH